MEPRPAARLAALARGRLSTKSRRLQRTRRKRIELESVDTSSRRCSPSTTWMRRTSRSGSTSWSSPTRRRRKLQVDQSLWPQRSDRQSCSVQSDYQVCEDSHRGEGGAKVEAIEGPDSEEDLVVDFGMDKNILHIELYTGQVLNIHLFTFIN